MIAIAAFRWYRKWRTEAGNREAMEVLRQIQRDRNSVPAAAAARTDDETSDAGEEDTSTCRVCLQGCDSIMGSPPRFLVEETSHYSLYRLQ